MRLQILAWLVAGGLLMQSGGSFAVDAGELEKHGVPESLLAWAGHSVRGDWDSVGAYGEIGAFGFGWPMVAGFRVSLGELLKKPRSQVRIWLASERRAWESVQRLGLAAVEGRKLCEAGRCARISASSLLAACRDGCDSPESPLRLWRRTGRCFGSVCAVMIGAAGIDVTEITGRGGR